ncbi:MAG: hypothetical protein AB1665_00785 [Candidatus Thermoplasmatota archaeon]
MDDLMDGLDTAIEQCMGVTKKDRILIVADTASKNIGLVLKQEGLKKTKHVRFFDLDMPAYGGRPLRAMPQGLLEALDDATVTFFLAAPKEGELKTVREPFLQKVIRRARHAHMVGVTEEIVRTGLRADYEKIEAVTMRLYEVLSKTREVAVRSPAGTDLRITFSPHVKWIPCTGILRRVGEWDNLPSGEVFTAPENIEGTAVVDGTVGDWIGDKYKERVDYRSTPLIVEIGTDEGPYLRSVRCRHPELLTDFQNYTGEERCASRVGEVGFGTNIFLKEFIGNILQDEKFPGAHIAFGDPYHEKTRAGWSCSHHIDLVMRECSVWADGKQIMERGRYVNLLNGV